MTKTMRLVLLASLALPASPAAARYHCARGQIYRVHQGVCVSRHGSRPLTYKATRRERRHRAPPVRAEEPSSKGLVYVTVVVPVVELPFALPGSIMNRVPVAYFDRLPP